jgi:hypothetical protein
MSQRPRQNDGHAALRRPQAGRVSGDGHLQKNDKRVAKFFMDATVALSNSLGKSGQVV